MKMHDDGHDNGDTNNNISGGSSSYSASNLTNTKHGQERQYCIGTNRSSGNIEFFPPTSKMTFHLAVKRKKVNMLFHTVHRKQQPI